MSEQDIIDIIAKLDTLIATWESEGKQDSIDANEENKLESARQLAAYYRILLEAY